MEYKKSLPNKIMNRVIDDTGAEINVTRLSEVMDKPVPSVWNKIAHKRRWDAETWLQTLWALGYAKYHRGRICISVPMSKQELRRLNDIKTDAIFVEEDS